MSPGISSAHAQVSLNDLYEHPHSTAGHSHTLTSVVLSSFRHTNTLYEHLESIQLNADAPPRQVCVNFYIFH